MKEILRILEIDKYERGIIINALNHFRNKLIKDKKNTDSVDEVIIKVLDAPEKKRCFHKGNLVEGR